LYVGVKKLKNNFENAYSLGAKFSIFCCLRDAWQDEKLCV